MFKTPYKQLVERVNPVRALTRLLIHGPQVDVMDHLFKDMRENPPLNKNQPPVAGAISWEKSLFHRIKHTIIRFQTMEEMMTSEQGKAVSISSPTTLNFYLFLSCN